MPNRSEHEPSDPSIKVMGSARVQDLHDSEYVVRAALSGNQYELMDKASGKAEIWQARDTPCAGYNLKYGPKYLEFVRGVGGLASPDLGATAGDVHGPGGATPPSDESLKVFAPGHDPHELETAMADVLIKLWDRWDRWDAMDAPELDATTKALVENLGNLGRLKGSPELLPALLDVLESHLQRWDGLDAEDAPGLSGDLLDVVARAEQAGIHAAPLPPDMGRSPKDLMREMRAKAIAQIKPGDRITDGMVAGTVIREGLAGPRGWPAWLVKVESGPQEGCETLILKDSVKGVWLDEESLAEATKDLISGNVGRDDGSMDAAIERNRARQVELRQQYRVFKEAEIMRLDQERGPAGLFLIPTYSEWLKNPKIGPSARKDHA